MIVRTFDSLRCLSILWLSIFSSALSSNLFFNCVNKPDITIDSIVKSDDGKLYVTSDRFYAHILHITSDHLPIVANGYPKLIDEEFASLKSDFTNMSAINYEFVNTQYYLKGPNEKQRKFIGFNQVWMGCPQPLCLHGNIDAVLKEEGYEENSINIKLFRGKYYWEIENYTQSPLVENAKLIKDIWNRKLNPPIDAAFTTWDLVPTFFIDDKKWSFRFEDIVEDINKTYKDIPAKVDAAMYWDRGSSHKEILFVFKDDTVWALRNGENLKGWPKNVKTINSNFPININAAFIDYNDTIYLFKDSTFYTFKANELESGRLSDEKLIPKLVFEHFYRCNRSLYNKWGLEGYDQFLMKYYPENYALMREEQEKLTRLANKRANNNEDINMIIIVILVVVIVTFAVMGVIVLIYCIIKFKKRADSQRTIDTYTTSRPLMNDNGNHIEIIQIEEFPNCKKGHRSVNNRNKIILSDEAYG